MPRVETKQKSIFNKKRIFTLKISPQNWAVKRVKDDFKWLVTALGDEFPNEKVRAALKY